MAEISDSDMMRPMNDETQPRVYENISTAECFVILLLCSPFYFFFAYYADEPFRGFVAALSAGVIISLIWLLRPLRGNPVFWAILSALALAHIMLVFFLPYTGEFRFGFAFFPLVVADIYLSGRFIIAACGVRAD